MQDIRRAVGNIGNAVAALVVGHTAGATAQVFRPTAFKALLQHPPAFEQAVAADQPPADAGAAAAAVLQPVGAAVAFVRRDAALVNGNRRQHQAGGQFFQAAENGGHGGGVGFESSLKSPIRLSGCLKVKNGHIGQKRC